jgi:hypothetical protein
VTPGGAGTGAGGGEGGGCTYPVGFGYHGTGLNPVGTGLYDGRGGGGGTQVAGGGDHVEFGHGVL